MPFNQSLRKYEGLVAVSVACNLAESPSKGRDSSFWLLVHAFQSQKRDLYPCFLLGSVWCFYASTKGLPSMVPTKGVSHGIDPIETHHKWRYATSGPPNGSFPNTNMFYCTMYAKHIHDTMIHISVHAHASTIALNRLVLRTAPSICRHISNTDDEWSAVRHVTPTISGLGNAGRLRRELAKPHRGKWS